MSGPAERVSSLGRSRPRYNFSDRTASITDCPRPAVKTTYPVRFNAYFSSREQPKIASDDRKTLFYEKSEMGFAKFPGRYVTEYVNVTQRATTVVYGERKTKKPDRNAIPLIVRTFWNSEGTHAYPNECA